MIYVHLSQKFIVAIYALCPPIFLASKVDSAIFFTFRMYGGERIQVWQNWCRSEAGFEIICSIYLFLRPSQALTFFVGNLPLD